MTALSKPTRLLSQGFLDLAKEQCEKALQNPERHRNVGDLMSKIAETPDQEQKHLGEIISISKPKRDFYKLIGRAVVTPDVTSVCLRNSWMGPDCILVATKTGDVVKFEGIFERDHNALAGLLSAIGGPLSNPALKRKHEVRYTGHFEGAVFFGKVSRKVEGESLLSSAAADDEIIMAMSAGGEKLEVMETPRTAAKFYQLSRV